MTEHKHHIVALHFAILELGDKDYIVARTICDEKDCNYETYRIGEAIEENYEV